MAFSTYLHHQWLLLTAEWGPKGPFAHGQKFGGVAILRSNDDLIAGAYRR